MKNRHGQGFTLIEMVVTVAIVGLLASAAMPLAQLGFRRAKEQELRLALREIRGGLDAYKKAADSGHMLLQVGDSGYPPTLDALVKGVPDARDAEGRLQYFLRRIPRDPFFPDPAVDPATSWGLRAYSSPPDSPTSGEDVFDVYSLDGRTGLDGVPYGLW
jgi:general secretion pathway protein G